MICVKLADWAGNNEMKNQLNDLMNKMNTSHNINEQSKQNLKLVVQNVNENKNYIKQDMNILVTKMDEMRKDHQKDIIAAQKSISDNMINSMESLKNSLSEIFNVVPMINNIKQQILDNANNAATINRQDQCVQTETQTESKPNMDGLINELNKLLILFDDNDSDSDDDISLSNDSDNDSNYSDTKNDDSDNEFKYNDDFDEFLNKFMIKLKDKITEIKTVQKNKIQESKNEYERLVNKNKENMVQLCKEIYMNKNKQYSNYQEIFKEYKNSSMQYVLSKTFPWWFGKHYNNNNNTNDNPITNENNLDNMDFCYK